MTQPPQSIPLNEEAWDAFDGDYESMPDQALADFVGAVYELVPEESSQFKGSQQLHITYRPLSLGADAKDRHNWYSGTTKVSTFGTLKASLAALGIPWSSTREMIREVLPGMVFHLMEKEVDTGRRQQQAAKPRLYPVEYLGYDPRIRAELDLTLPAGAPTFNPLDLISEVSDEEPLSNEDAEALAIDAISEAGGMTLAQMLGGFPPEVRANPTFMAQVRNRSWPNAMVEAGRLEKSGNTFTAPSE